MSNQPEMKKGFKLELGQGASWPRSNIDALTDDELIHEYHERIPVLSQMGGHMYQSILCDELNALQGHIVGRGFTINDDKTVGPKK